MRVQLLQTPRKIGQAVADRVLQAGHGLRQHDGQRIFAGAARAGEDERGRHAFRRDRLAQMADRGRIPRKLIKAHIMRLAKTRAHSRSSTALRSGPNDKREGRHPSPLKPKYGLNGPPKAFVEV
jgi:hypothetical protein